MGVPNAAGLWQVTDIENYAIFKIKWCRRSASNGRGSDCYELGGNKPGQPLRARQEEAREGAAQPALRSAGRLQPRTW